jgi:aerobic carbon-monoxide dehydrogenase medium subunit
MIGKTNLFRPDNLSEALDLLSTVQDVRPLAGGASLVAMINARIVEPAALVSLTNIPELRGIRVSPAGGLVIGATTRHREVGEDPRLTGTLAVVPDAAGQIASAPIRNMGTIGGAVAHADPGLDFPPALVAAQAVIEVASTAGRRNIPVAEFFVDWYTTLLKAGEIVVAVHLPEPKPGVGLYLKHARVAGDFAVASVALSMAKDGEVHVAVGGCGPMPLASAGIDRILSSSMSDAALEQAGKMLVGLADPIDDVRGTAEYRRMLIPRMLRRATYEAAARSAG